MRRRLANVLVMIALIGATICERMQINEQQEPEINVRERPDLDSALSHMRMVVKNGIKVKGTYSYSDGHARRTIYYIADDKGYRITGEDVMPLDDLTVILNKHEEAIAAKTIINKDEPKAGTKQNQQQHKP